MDWMITEACTERVVAGGGATTIGVQIAPFEAVLRRAAIRMGLEVHDQYQTRNGTRLHLENYSILGDRHEFGYSSARLWIR